MASRGRLSFVGKKILAPMVRIGTLPARLMALEYGADIVYTHEVIDYKLLACDRVQNDLLGTIDFVLADGTVVLRTCEAEKEKVVFQVGTCSAERALKVAEKIQRDVAGIDVNMGCPKEFSLKGGMGAALLKKPDKIREILTTLVERAPDNLTVTCKIRILKTLEETVALAKMIESCGVNALAVHGRRTAERPRHPNHNDVIRAVSDALSIPVIANGGSRDHIKTYEDIERFRALTGAASVMIGRTAMWNLSVFRKDGPIPLEEILLIYLKKSVCYDYHLTGVKYCLQNMLHEQLETPRGKRLLSCDTVREICELWGQEEFYDDTHREWAEWREKRRGEEEKKKREEEEEEEKRRLEEGACSPPKRQRLEVVTMDIRVNKRDFDGSYSPKQLLHDYALKHELTLPSYETPFHEDKRVYSSVCTILGRQYATTFRHMSKKFVEHGSAAVALRSLGLRDGLVARPENAILEQREKVMNSNSQNSSSSSQEISKTENGQLENGEKVIGEGKSEIDHGLAKAAIS